MPSRMPIDAQCNECTYLNNPGGEGRPSSIAAASATEEVTQSGSVPRDPPPYIIDPFWLRPIYQDAIVRAVQRRRDGKLAYIVISRREARMQGVRTNSWEAQSPRCFAKLQQLIQLKTKAALRELSL